MSPKRGLATVVVLFALGAAAAPSFASQINTGEDGGTYQARFCPELAKNLARAELAYACAPSAGTAANVERTAANPAEMGYGQLDLYARDIAKRGEPGALVQVRTDDVRLCLFAVTRRPDLQTFGELSAVAPELKIILPPEGSDSAGTFQVLSEIDGTGLGKAGSIQHAASTEAAIRQALSEDNAVAFFVSFPDPASAPFKAVDEAEGHYVPIIDREILRQTKDGQKLYFAQETQVSNATWLEGARKVVTACTPMVLFTGSPEKLTDSKARSDHEDLIATVRALRSDALLPQDGAFARVLARTKELSATSAEKLIKASEQARENAKPYLERAKEATDKALDAAKPALERAKEYGRKVYEKGREELKELMEPSTDKPAEQPKQ